MRIFNIFCGLLLLCIPAPLLAQDGFSVHGYLSQAFSKSYKHQIFGIPQEGTSDYRNLAIQFRYDTKTKNSFVVQFSHRRQGYSPAMSTEQDVLLDWAFVEHRFNNIISAKFGKIQLPFGIYNEIRDVGTLLPFYHLPYAPYGEGTYTSETVSGLTMSANIFTPGDWEIRADIYGGEWDWKGYVILKNPINGAEITITDTPTIKQAIGGRLMLSPPFAELTVGVSGYTAIGEGGYSFSPEFGLGRERLSVVNFTVDAAVSSASLKSELTRYYFKENNFSATGFYVQTGWQIHPLVQLHGQYTTYYIYDLPVSPFSLEPLDAHYYHDTGLSITLHPTTQIVLRGEFHWNRGFVLDEYYDDYPPDSPPSMQYLIISIATSF